MTERIEINILSEVIVLDGIPYCGDCETTELLVDAIRQQQADIAELRAKLDAYERAPTVAWRVVYIGEDDAVLHLVTPGGPHAELYRDLPNTHTIKEMIDRPAKD